MTSLTRLLQWMVKAVVFFVLFAFALNNQQDATVHLLFGQQWRAPMMLIVLAAFALGMVVGVLGMLPGWWRRRQPVREDDTAAAPLDAFASPPRHGA
ncbi:MAG: LapA family protein [Pseudomonadota bacterium]|nr:LapA family protein [Pseudomonadota bacterium]